MEEQILHYYLKVSSIVIILFLILIFSYFFYVINKDINLTNNLFKIQKGEKIEKFINNNINYISNLEILIIKTYFRATNVLSNNFIHYGDFYIDKKISFIDLFQIITKPSNLINKITIVEGWSQKQLQIELSKYFNDVQKIHFEDIIADTYFFNADINSKSFIKKLKTYKKKYFEKYKKNKIYQNFTINEIMVIGSLIEKEALDYDDKSKISSVIFNRLYKKMKLQIDATVLYAITEGDFKLNRKLLLKDLKVNHPFNTYQNYGLPPKPISYVGKKTLDIIFENHKTDFLFYFFNKSLNKHIFSKNYEDHKKKLNEYRAKK